MATTITTATTMRSASSACSGSASPAGLSRARPRSSSCSRRSRCPALAGLGVLAYTFGLRHAFDADHIAAIDNTTRKLLQERKRPLGAGFFFSLGHSTIVFALAIGLALAAHAVDARIPSFQAYGSTI